MNFNAYKGTILFFIRIKACEKPIITEDKILNVQYDSLLSIPYFCRALKMDTVMCLFVFLKMTLKASLIKPNRIFAC